jgi:arylsulfatase A-like enzyme
MKSKIISTGTLALSLSLMTFAQDRPNVVFIMSDDLNDWIGALGGNPQVKTPNLDRFCNEKAMVFFNNHCPGPVCGPSRSAMLSGFRPETSGVYGNAQNMLQSALVQQNATLPEYFSAHGYITISKGKIFHRHQTALGYDAGQWAYDIWEPATGSSAAQTDKLYSRLKGLYNGVKNENMLYEGGTPGNELAWAPTVKGKEETFDYLTASWFVEQLKKDYSKPFFMFMGISKPHLPWYVPQEFYDKYEIDSIKIPEYKLDDLDDILTPMGKIKFSMTGDVRWLLQDEMLFKHSVRAYMAAVSYVDECIGLVLDAIDNSKYKDNTIIVIMGDHGWHLGEKLKFGKAALWSETTRTPLIIMTPEMIQGSRCNRVVNLMDMYPSLIELCGLPIKENIEGRSIVPLLSNSDLVWPYPSITTYNKSFTTNDEEWRYTKYSDGTEELYNMKIDPMEWNNLIKSTEIEAIQAKSRLASFIPSHSANDVPNDENVTVINKPDMTIKATRPIFTIGVENANSQLNNFFIYPNPVTDEFTLLVNNNQIGRCEYRLVDSSGKLIENKVITAIETVINMKNMDNGFYFLKCSDMKRKEQMFKIVKN